MIARQQLRDRRGVKRSTPEAFPSLQLLGWLLVLGWRERIVDDNGPANLKAWLKYLHSLGPSMFDAEGFLKQPGTFTQDVNNVVSGVVYDTGVSGKVAAARVAEEDRRAAQAAQEAEAPKEQEAFQPRPGQMWIGPRPEEFEPAPGQMSIGPMSPETRRAVHPQMGMRAMTPREKAYHGALNELREAKTALDRAWREVKRLPTWRQVCRVLSFAYDSAKAALYRYNPVAFLKEVLDNAVKDALFAGETTGTVEGSGRAAIVAAAKTPAECNARIIQYEYQQAQAAHDRGEGPEPNLQDIVAKRARDVQEALSAFDPIPELAGVAKAYARVVNAETAVLAAGMLLEQDPHGGY